MPGTRAWAGITNVTKKLRQPSLRRYWESCQESWQDLARSCEILHGNPRSCSRQEFAQNTKVWSCQDYEESTRSWQEKQEKNTGDTREDPVSANWDVNWFEKAWLHWSDTLESSTFPQLKFLLLQLSLGLALSKVLNCGVNFSRKLNCQLNWGTENRRKY